MSTPRKRTLIPAGSASAHDEAPKPLVGTDGSKRATIGLEYLTYEQLEDFGRELDAIRQAVLDDLGQEDADYIRKVDQGPARVRGRGPRSHVSRPSSRRRGSAGVASLSLSKILENMEIGHNVMHGQYDWMNDPKISGHDYDWDNVSPGEDWKRTHNFEHRTYTNIHGKDQDIGYGLVRIDEDQPYSYKYLGNPVYAVALMLLFELGVMLHGTPWNDLHQRPEDRRARA